MKWAAIIVSFLGLIAVTSAYPQKMASWEQIDTDGDHIPHHRVPRGILLKLFLASNAAPRPTTFPRPIIPRLNIPQFNLQQLFSGSFSGSFNKGGFFSSKTSSTSTTTTTEAPDSEIAKPIPAGQIALEDVDSNDRVIGTPGGINTETRFSSDSDSDSDVKKSEDSDEDSDDFSKPINAPKVVPTDSESEDSEEISKDEKTSGDVTQETPTSLDIRLTSSIKANNNNSDEDDEDDDGDKDTNNSSSDVKKPDDAIISSIFKTDEESISISAGSPSSSLSSISNIHAEDIKPDAKPDDFSSEEEDSDSGDKVESVSVASKNNDDEDDDDDDKNVSLFGTDVKKGADKPETLKPILKASTAGGYVYTKPPVIAGPNRVDDVRPTAFTPSVIIPTTYSPPSNTPLAGNNVFTGNTYLPTTSSPASSAASVFSGNAYLPTTSSPNPQNNAVIIPSTYSPPISITPSTPAEPNTAVELSHDNSVESAEVVDDDVELQKFDRTSPPKESLQQLYVPAKAIEIASELENADNPSTKVPLIHGPINDNAFPINQSPGPVPGQDAASVQPVSRFDDQSDSKESSEEVDRTNISSVQLDKVLVNSLINSITSTTEKGTADQPSTALRFREDEPDFKSEGADPTQVGDIRRYIQETEENRHLNIIQAATGVRDNPEDQRELHVAINQLVLKRSTQAVPQNTKDPRVAFAANNNRYRRHAVNRRDTSVSRISRYYLH